jgi:hypothetical protein
VNSTGCRNAYAIGERSSRGIERRCREDIAFRVITANQVPDHATIARFRARHEQALAEMFTQILALCARAGLVSVGLVALDGTRMCANAVQSANRTHEAIREEVERILAEAGRADAEEDERFGEARGDELPSGLIDRRSRIGRLRQCREELEAEQAQAQVAYEENLQWRADWEATLASSVVAGPPRLIRTHSPSGRSIGPTRTPGLFLGRAMRSRVTTRRRSLAPDRSFSLPISLNRPRLRAAGTNDRSDQRVAGARRCHLPAIGGARRRRLLEFPADRDAREKGYSDDRSDEGHYAQHTAEARRQTGSPRRDGSRRCSTHTRALRSTENDSKSSSPYSPTPSSSDASTGSNAEDYRHAVPNGGSSPRHTIS